MNGSPTVSVIMPCFNSALWVEEAIRSIHVQSFEDWELLVVDDGSSDDSYQRILMLCSGDSRIIAARLDQHQGAVSARNYGLSMARGRYLAFCDSDDLWLPDKLTTQLKAMQSSKHAICCTAYFKVSEEGVCSRAPFIPPEHIDYSRLLQTNDIGMSTAMIDTHITGPIQLPDIARRQDYALWVKLMAQGHTALGLSEPLAHYRVRNGSLSSNKVIAAYYHWRVLREVADLPLKRALPCFFSYIKAGARKKMM